MKVIQRGIGKIRPDKMAEARELEKKEMELQSRSGVPPAVTRYRPLIGGGSVMHTVVFQSEWDSMAAMEAAFDEALADPEMQKLLSEWAEVLESYELELWVPLP